MSTTNVHPDDLNYDHYEDSKYEQEIVRVIPGHRQLHHHMLKVLQNTFGSSEALRVLDLGAGTGLSSQAILSIFPNSHITVVDFSANMMKSAKKKLGMSHSYILGDYAVLDFPKLTFDVVLSVIGLHHQTDIGKRKVIKKIHQSLRPGGLIILGDLVTFRNQHTAAVAKAKHYSHMVQHSSSPEKLEEWAYHHEFLNDLANLEDMQEWLHEIGFTVTTLFVQYQTVLFCGRKQ